MSNINRREVLMRLSAVLGVAFTEPLMAGVMGKKTYSGPVVAPTAVQEALVAEIADVIIPTTSTPGAKAAGAHHFIIRVIRDCYQQKDQEEFYAGVNRIAQKAKSQFNKEFADLTDTQKKQLVQDAADHDKAFFGHMKSLTVTGYFTSEIGATQALDYLPIPGRFEGSYPLKPDQKTWAL